MVTPKQFVESLAARGLFFFTGVPDSLLKDLLAYIQQTVNKEAHITAANEGNAIGIAAGYYLATGKAAVVYLQNSGLGNTVNPLASLADPEVYAIPMLLVVGWRGEPGVKDEPQHIKQGRITPELLETLMMPHAVLAPDMRAEAIAGEVSRMAQIAINGSCRPAALVVRSGVFEPQAAPKRAPLYPLAREEAIAQVIAAMGPRDIVVSTTGKISRELCEARKKAGQGGERDFLTVGSMGHASQIALGIAQQKKSRQVWCLDGDGSVLMHMGGLATVGWVSPQNFRHVVFNNLAHESVGGQPSAAGATDIPAVAKASGYRLVATAANKEELAAALQRVKIHAGPVLLEVKVNLESRKDLMRPKETPAENKKKFMEYLNDAN